MDELRQEPLQDTSTERYERAYAVFQNLMNVPHLRKAAEKDFGKAWNEITLEDMIETLTPNAIESLITWREQTDLRSVRLSVKRRERWKHGGRP